VRRWRLAPSHPLPIARMLGLLGARRITLQARYRRLRDIERPRYIRLRVAVSEALACTATHNRRRLASQITQQ